MSLILLPLNSAKDAVLVEQKFGTSFTVDSDDGSLSVYHKPDYSQLSTSPDPTPSATDYGVTLEYTDNGNRFRWTGTIWVKTHISGTAIVPDYYLSIKKGEITGHESISVSGRNKSVGASFEDIWDGGSLSSLDYDAQTANFTSGLVITGGTSLATAVIVTDVDSGATGQLVIRKIAGTFIDNEIITDSGTGSATANSVIASLGVKEYPTAGESWEVICESTDDSSAGIGARTVKVFYEDDSYNRQDETISLSGQTAVSFVASNSFRLLHVEVMSWGSSTDAVIGKSNLGTIIVRDSSSKKIRGSIAYDDSILGDERGQNSSKGSHYTVPAGKTAYLVSAAVNTSKNHESDTVLLIRKFGEDAFKILGHQDVYQNSVSVSFLEAPALISEKSDIKMISRSNNTSVPVNIRYSLILVDN